MKITSKYKTFKKRSSVNSLSAFHMQASHHHKNLSLGFRVRILHLGIAASLVISNATAHEGAGRSGFKEPADVEIEGEFYAGKRGYLHGGLGVIMPLGEGQELGFVSHFVREDSDGEIFTSLGAEYIRELEDGYAMEISSFGYLPVESQHALGIGLRGNRSFEMNDRLSLTPFFGPSLAWVQAIDEATNRPVDINHLMLMGGLLIDIDAMRLTVFGSHSFFSSDPVGLETHVDLEEMTHFAAYENNDGFASNTAGLEISYPLTEAITLHGKYAWLDYEDRTRHAITFTPSLKLDSRWEIFAGIQLLRGDGPDNNLLVTGATFLF